MGFLCRNCLFGMDIITTGVLWNIVIADVRSIIVECKICVELL